MPEPKVKVPRLNHSLNEYGFERSKITLCVFDRKISALLKLSNVLECKKLMVITRDFEQVLEIDHKTIVIIPVWKWLLNLLNGC